ncbi:unnamed protein product [Linum trigynum]|uniref:Uncharacterized protein n=1 Tax=Linum trigynum TaxID=586398 RepID=A0AAV2CLB8_9ROSI
MISVARGLRTTTAISYPRFENNDDDFQILNWFTRKPACNRGCMALKTPPTMHDLRHYHCLSASSGYRTRGPKQGLQRMDGGGDDDLMAASLPGELMI